MLFKSPQQHDLRHNTAPQTPSRPVFIPQPAEPNLIIFAETPATASKLKHGVNLKLNHCIESSDPIKMVQGKQNNCTPCDEGQKENIPTSNQQLRPNASCLPKTIKKIIAYKQPHVCKQPHVLVIELAVIILGMRV